MWYYACHGTEYEEGNTIALSLTSIDVTSSNTKRLYCSRYESVYRSKLHRVSWQSSTLERERERERENKLVRVFKQRHLPLQSH